MELTNLINELTDKTKTNIENFEIETVDSIKHVYDNAYLEKPTWLGASDIICVFIDMNDSTLISNLKKRATVAKIYMAFTQNLVETLKKFNPSYLDIKGDGVFALFEGENAHNYAIAAAVTFKTFNEKFIKQYCLDSFQVAIDCKIAIDKEQILVKRIGLRDTDKEKKSNEVWAGNLINNTSKLSNVSKEIKDKENNGSSCIVVSEKFYNLLCNDENTKEFTITSCGCPGGKKVKLWKEYNEFDKDVFLNSDNYQKVFYLFSNWCDSHCEEYCNSILQTQIEE